MIGEIYGHMHPKVTMQIDKILTYSHGLTKDQRHEFLKLGLIISKDQVTTAF